MKNYDEIIKKLKDNVNVISEMVSDVNSYNGNLECYEWFVHDEDFFETYFASKDEVARAVFYGDYRYCDDYVRFNAYCNLETCSEYERNEILIDNVEEIYTEWLELYQEGNVCELSNDEIMELIKGGVKND